MTPWREDAAATAGASSATSATSASSLFWSAGLQPVCRPPDSYEVVFSADKADLPPHATAGSRHITGVTVTPEHRAEIRRVTLVNHRLPRRMK